ncbi:MAG TPA: tetratricopeptide repeat protein [Chloroflexia bacterium]|nr:tetratricopeptide repeat protein [Chloroflexia bacterium]
MSTQPRRVPKSATKRRAMARKRTRELGRQLFAYFIIGILVIGTLSSVVFAPVAGTNAPAVAPTSTSLSGNTFDALLQQGDASMAAGKANEAVGYYGAYISQNPGNAEANLKLARALIDSNPPRYTEASEPLNRVLSIDPSGPYAGEATTLLGQIKDKITPGASTTGTAGTAGTGSTTGTSTAGTGALTSGTAAPINTAAQPTASSAPNR